MVLNPKCCSNLKGVTAHVLQPEKEKYMFLILMEVQKSSQGAAVWSQVKTKNKGLPPVESVL